MRIIIIGFGTVGQAFGKILYDKNKELSKNFGLRPKIVAVVDRGGAIISESGLDFNKIVKAKEVDGSVASDSTFGKPKMNGIDVIDSVEADVVIEATPTNITDGQPGLSNIKEAFKTKKNVITTNKGPLAIALPSLLELAKHNHVILRFTGTVGGGTPILSFGKKCLRGDKLISVKGILNGTTNYILTRMAESHTSFEEALKEAQKSGYAESDPSYDINGVDSACKLVIISNWLMNKNVTIKDVNIQGISNITLNDLENAKKKGFLIKLIAYANDSELSVEPQLLSRDNPLCVRGTLNAVAFGMEYSGDVTLIGSGAGGAATAGAVLKDLIDIRGELSL